MEALPNPLSSRAKPRDPRCAPRSSRILGLKPKTSNHKQKCHPDRSEAKWRDLLFIIRVIESEWKRCPTLCHPERSRGIRGAPLGPPEFSVSNLKPQTTNRSVIPTGAKRSGGTCCSSSASSNLNGSATPPFVIPSEAEGSAVRPSVLPNSRSQTYNLKPQTD